MQRISQVYKFATQITNQVKITAIFNQAKGAIQSLIQFLDELYLSHQVYFPVRHFFSSLMRLLTPIQFMKNIDKKNEEQNKENKKKQQMKRAGPRLRILKQGLQRELCDWIIRTTEAGYNVTRKSIKERGKDLIGPSKFKCSDGWCDKFLLRNPHIKAIVTKVKDLYGSNVSVTDKKQIAKARQIHQHIYKISYNTNQLNQQKFQRLNNHLERVQQEDQNQEEYDQNSPFETYLQQNKSNQSYEQRQNYNQKNNNTQQRVIFQQNQGEEQEEQEEKQFGEYESYRQNQKQLKKTNNQIKFQEDGQPRKILNYSQFNKIGRLPSYFGSQNNLQMLRKRCQEGLKKQKLKLQNFQQNFSTSEQSNNFKRIFKK